MGHQSYVLLCSKITSFPPSEGEFLEKSGIFSKVKHFQKDLRTLSQGVLNRWTSQLDLGCTTGGLERVVSVHNST